MPENLMGYSWEEKAQGYSLPSGPVMEYSNAKIGTFYLSRMMRFSVDQFDAARVLSAIYHQNIAGKPLLICQENEKASWTQSPFRPATLQEIYMMHPSTIMEKQNAILKMLYRHNPNIGEAIELEDFQPYMFYAKNDSEMGYLLELMNAKELIRVKVSWTSTRKPILGLPLTIDEKGWILLEDIIHQENSNNVFVAMWFDPSMDPAYISIRDALGSLGFQAMRIDRKQHNNEISGEILYEIRKCRFIIADVTNQRHGVYFEAGYALGRGIPIIWSCKSNDLINVHFDTRQYNHIVWENETELREKLVDRIKGTIIE